MADSGEENSKLAMEEKDDFSDSEKDVEECILPLPNSVVTVETVTEMPDGGTKSVTLINLEQCSICSTFYEQVKRAIPQPDLNRLICRLLEIQPGDTPAESQAFFGSYIPICTDCTQKVKKYHSLKIEMEVVKSDIVSSLVDTLVHIRPSGSTPIHAVKSQIFKRWSTVKVGDSEVVVTSSAPTKPVKAFVINATDKNHKSDEHSKMTRVKLQASKSFKKEVANGPTISQWVYDIIDPSDPHIPNLTVAEEVVVSTPTEFSIVSGEDNLNYDGEDYFGDDGQDWFIQQISSPGSKKRKNTKTQTTKGDNSQDVKQPKRPRKLNRKNDATPKIPPPPHFCDGCGRVFVKWATLKSHQSICTKNEGDRKRVCPLCGLDLSSGSWQDFKTHFDETHPNSVLERCVTCRMDFLPTILQTHVCGFKSVDYAGLKPDFKCDICDKAYVTRCNLTDHIRRAHKDAEKWTCEACKKTYSSKMLLEEHKKIHQRVSTGFECKICGTFCTSAWGLKQHTRIHTGELPFSCTICNKSFRCASVLKNHAVTHSKEKKFCCEICGLKFGLQGTMTRHWKRHQLPDTNYTKKCPICPDKKFKKVWVLKAHMIQSHNDTPELRQVFEKYSDVDDRPRSQIKAAQKYDDSDMDSDDLETKNKPKRRSGRKSKSEFIIPDSDNSLDSDEQSDATPIFITNELENDDSCDENNSDQSIKQSDRSKCYTPPSKRKRKVSSDTTYVTDLKPLVVAHSSLVAPRVSPRRKKNVSLVDIESKY